MAWQRKLTGGMLTAIGYLLSPLSWWNDLFVNVPLALAFAWLVSLAYKPAFNVAVVVGYWFTNVAGFVLMHKGLAALLKSEQERRDARRELWKDVLVSLAYTGLILVLLKFGVLQPFDHYFRKA